MEWVCSNPDWIITPLGNAYRCRLVVTTLGQGVLKAFTHSSTGCDTSYGLEITATYFDVDEHGTAAATLYPNPAETKITIEATEIQRIRLIDALGQALINKEYDSHNSVTLDISHLPAGVYMVEIATRLGRATRRLVVTR